MRLLAFLKQKVSQANFKKKTIFFLLLISCVFSLFPIFICFHQDSTSAPTITQNIFTVAFAADSQNIGNTASTQSTYHTIVNIPLIGDIDAKAYSLPTLAALLGLVDGFNPCAMWVLVYLISIAMTVNDRRKLWLLVGSFVAASGVLYFLFMTAWLNAFLIIGYIRPLTLLIGIFAIVYGIKIIRDFIVIKGAEACKIMETESRKKTMAKIHDIFLSPVAPASIIGIIGLAFAVNSIEFLCSAGLPAIFTHVLSISALDTLQYYLYIALYILFFMLDDLLIFGSAVLAIKSSPGERYAKHTKPVAGIIMILLGTVMVFFPDLLR